MVIRIAKHAVPMVQHAPLVTRDIPMLLEAVKPALEDIMSLLPPQHQHLHVHHALCSLNAVFAHRQPFVRHATADMA